MEGHIFGSLLRYASLVRQVSICQEARRSLRAKWGAKALGPLSHGLPLCAPHPASSPSPEGQDARRPRSRNPSTWSVEDVVWFVKDADPQALGPHVELFRKHEIDGNALLLLKSEMIMKYLGLKLGPALKLCYHIDKLKQAKF
ncbi:Sex comb on midleg-like protein 4 [Camelus dromedarius]|uniref:Sex comb on midleg-like protein 4 n=1 Tax=Camelus dromedarius TaxID=9838 RepID=A0A5N4DXH2_CAMDR|nr:Sex comb on midleg-like protein 4 [Camelus dromedarius]KAB1275787.1 Sex comb on midleg-like protein 4 [Camelus dromedarius]